MQIFHSVRYGTHNMLCFGLYVDFRTLRKWVQWGIMLHSCMPLQLCRKVRKSKNKYWDKCSRVSFLVCLIFNAQYMQADVCVLLIKCSLHRTSSFRNLFPDLNAKYRVNNWWVLEYGITFWVMNTKIVHSRVHGSSMKRRELTYTKDIDVLKGEHVSHNV